MSTYREIMESIVANATREELEQLVFDQDAEIQRLIKENARLHKEFEIMGNDKKAEQ